MSECWPQDQTDTLIRLWQANKSSGEIANRMGITRNMVMGKASRLGLKHERVKRVNYMPRVSKPKDKRPPVTLKPQAQTSHPISFLEADHTTCKWPLWWADAMPRMVCGAEPIPTKPYCAFHYNKAFVELWRNRADRVYGMTWSRRKAC